MTWFGPHKVRCIGCVEYRCRRLFNVGEGLYCRKCRKKVDDRCQEALKHPEKWVKVDRPTGRDVVYQP